MLTESNAGEVGELQGLSFLIERNAKGHVGTQFGNTL
jgi:hypothetical protein